MNRDLLQTQWSRKFTEALELDSWGQLLEASEAYENLARQINSILHGSHHLGVEERSLLIKLVTCLNVRAKSAESISSTGLSTDDMKKLDPLFKSVFSSGPSMAFPINTLSFPEAGTTGIKNKDAGVITIDDRQEEKEDGGTLLPAPPASLGAGKALTIVIDKMGFKDPALYLSPFITVSIMMKDGRLIEPAQDTPVSNKKKPNDVVFNDTCHIQTRLEQLPTDCAIFFEFKHYKPKKQKVSTKAWCFMEMNEIKPGPMALEIYNKPTDPKRKKLRLLSIKQLFLHLNLRITEH